jgi:N-acetylneuraminate lyase
MRFKLTGLIAAPFTPMHSDGSLNAGIVEQQAASLVANGVNGAFICGTTGEGLSLSTVERLELAERWRAAAPPQLKLIVHVGHNSLAESQGLARHAETMGAQAVATIGPTFFRPTQIEQLVEYCARVAEAAPALPFYYYHMPAMTGVNLSMLEFLQIASARIPNLAGIKFTDENLMSYAQCLEFEGGRFNVLFGRDEILLSALALGATGAVGSTYNFMAPLYHEVMAAFQAGNLTAARTAQMTAMRLIAVVHRFGGLPALKAMMKLAGIDCGPVRLPLRALTAEETEQMRSQLEKLGFPLAAGNTRHAKP